MGVQVGGRVGIWVGGWTVLSENSTTSWLILEAEPSQKGSIKSGPRLTVRPNHANHPVDLIFVQISK